MKKRYFKWLLLPLAAVLILALGFGAWYFGLLPERSYKAKDFGIQTLKSQSDYDADGIDDYADLLAGAKKDAANRPRYDGSYHAGGYPPENIGVCTDLVWRAFREAGYSLKDMVDADIAARPEAYPKMQTPDPNIDFRRVGNLHIFFEEYALSLTCDTADIAAWQPGDIVIFGNDKHIGIVSDKRNAKGQPFILHNGGQFKREENYLPRAEVTAHYRIPAQGLAEKT